MIKLAFKLPTKKGHRSISMVNLNAEWISQFFGIHRGQHIDALFWLSFGPDRKEEDIK